MNKTNRIFRFTSFYLALLLLLSGAPSLLLAQAAEAIPGSEEGMMETEYVMEEETSDPYAGMYEETPGWEDPDQVVFPSEPEQEEPAVAEEPAYEEPMDDGMQAVEEVVEEETVTEETGAGDGMGETETTEDPVDDGTEAVEETSEEETGEVSPDVENFVIMLEGAAMEGEELASEIEMALTLEDGSYFVQDQLDELEAEYPADDEDPTLSAADKERIKLEKNLKRFQIILKGWQDKKGEVEEKINRIDMSIADAQSKIQEIANDSSKNPLTKRLETEKIESSIQRMEDAKTRLNNQLAPIDREIERNQRFVEDIERQLNELNGSAPM